MTEGETTRRDCSLLSAEPGFEMVGEAADGQEAIAESTVKNHMRNILETLHLENRVQAAAFALGRKTSGRSPAD